MNKQQLQQQIEQVYLDILIELNLDKVDTYFDFIFKRRFCSPASARMTSVESSLVQAYFQFSHLLPI